MPSTSTYRRRSIAFLLLCVSSILADGSYYEASFAASQDPAKLQVGVTYRLWVPDATETIRGIIVHQHGCGTGACQGGETAADDLHWQALAQRWDCALLGPSYHQAEEQNCRLWCDPRNGSSDVFCEALSALANESGHPEVADVPWCLWGHSGGGFWASLMQMEFPERIVAIWFQSGTAHSRWTSGEIPAPEIPPAAMQIPMMANTGLAERDHERFKTAWFGTLEMFRDYRSRGAPIAFVPDPKSGHETRDSRYLAIPFFDACLDQRLPAQAGAASPLRAIDFSKGWLAHVPADPSMPQPDPVPAADFEGDAAKAVWLPSQRVAAMWSEFIGTGEVGDVTAPPAPFAVKAEQIGQGVTVSWKATADFESGIGAFEILRDGVAIGRIPDQPSTRFGRSLFQKMSYHDTPEAPLPEMRFVDNGGTMTDKYSVKAINSVGLRSPAATASVLRNLVFAEVESQELKLDIYLPTGVQAAPLVVWIHGGGWRAGSKNNPPIKPLTEHGLALASISYRFTDKAIFPAQIHDCKAAIRWLRRHALQYGFDADRIAVAGGSAGGHLALLVGVSGDVQELEGNVGGNLDQSSTVQAVIDYYGPSDFVLRGKTQPDRAYTEKSGSFALLGGLQTGKLTPEMESLASPASYVTANDPPLLVFHGTADEVVLLDQSERIIELYQDAGLASKLVVLDEAGHGGKQFFQQENLATVIDFLNRQWAK